MWMFAIIVPTLCFIHAVLSNSPPTFITRGPFSIPEDKPIDSTLFNLSALDSDGGGTLHFRIESPATDELVTFGNSFYPDGNTKSRPIKLKKQLDRDYEPGVRNLVFSVNDGQYTSTATILIIITDVNDEPPKFDAPGYRVSVKESETVGNDVSKVSASDPDTGSGGDPYYGLKARGQNADEYRYTFIVNKTSGRISLNESLDYEDRTFYQYNAIAWDDNQDEEHAGNRADPVDFFVTVLDVQDTPPFFRNQSYIHTIDENVTVGTSVIKVLASDGDLGVSNQLEYYLFQGDNDSGSFRIDANNGDITTRVLLDADSDQMKQKGGILSFHVNASEVVPPSQEQLGETSSSTQVTITIRDVNDNPPSFTSNNIVAEVFENSPIGVPLTLTHSVEVKDIDMTSTNNLFELFVEKNGELCNDFDTVPGNNQPVSRSYIMIRVNNTDLLDYEQRTNVTFQIVAKESQSFEKLTGSVSVVVNIINVNDNSPLFENKRYTFNMSENATIHDVVGQVQAHDADGGIFGEVSYHLEDPDTDFSISATDGTITVSKDLDRERRSSYSFLVLAYDNDAISRRTGHTRVDIHINGNFTKDHIDRINVKCNAKEMSVVVPMDVIQQVFQGVSPHDLTLSDPNCTGQVYSDMVIFQSSILGCGMTREETRYEHVYQNQIHRPFRTYNYTGTTENTGGAAITRFESQDIKIQCSLDNYATAAGVYRPQNHEVIARGHGNFSVYMDFYHDSNYNYKITSYPISLALDQDIYVDVRLDAADPGLKISPQNCFATPSYNPYPYFNNRHNLITDGCPADPTVTVVNSPNQHIHLHFKTFEFLKDKDQVYIFCQVNLCNDADSYRRCQHDCYGRHRRDAIDTAQDKAHDLRIFQGPLKLRTERSAEQEKKQDFAASSTIPAVAAVAMVIAAVVMVIKKRSHNGF